MKTWLENIDATPEKRSYWAIVNDYDFNTALCELIDNPLDVWLKREDDRGKLTVNVTASVTEQIIRIDDDSGGIHRHDLKLIVRPGASANLETNQTVGIFGVGSKRSVIALAKDVKVTTRISGHSTFRVEYGDKWLAEETWDVPCFEVPPQAEGHTIVDLTNPRQPVTKESVSELMRHLSETYALFLADHRFELNVNSVRIEARAFDDWAFPPDYRPTEVKGKIKLPEHQHVRFSITAGLLKEPQYSSGEYGVYVYCNDRLIAKALRVPEVGFRKGEAGVPHHSHSIARVIVALKGPAKAMPWNSNKSGVHYGHETFKRIQQHVVSLTSAYATLSKRLQPSWADEIFPYTSGDITTHNLKPDDKISSISLPPIPRVRPSYAAQLVESNVELLHHEPWKTLIVDGVIATDTIQKQKLRSRNTFTVILLDGILELGFKEYLIRHADRKISDDELSAIVSDRERLEREVRAISSIPEDAWAKLTALAVSRREIACSRFPKILTDGQIEEMRRGVQIAFRKLFNVSFPDRSGPVISEND